MVETTLQKFRPWPISAFTNSLLRLLIVTCARPAGRRRRVVLVDADAARGAEQELVGAGGSKGRGRGEVGPDEGALVAKGIPAGCRVPRMREVACGQAEGSPRDVVLSTQDGRGVSARGYGAQLAFAHFATFNESAVLS